MGRRHLTCPRRSPRCLFCWARWLGLVPSFRARCRAAESLARPGTHWWGIPARAVTHAASWSGAAPRPAGYKNHFPQLPLPCPRPASLCASAVLLCAPCPVFKVRETERNRIGSALLLQPHRQSRRKHVCHFDLLAWLFRVFRARSAQKSHNTILNHPFYFTSFLPSR